MNAYQGGVATRKRRLQVFSLSLFVAAAHLVLPQDTPSPVDFDSQIRPILQGGCDGEACHIRQWTSGINLSDHTAVTESVGHLYGRPIVVPFDAEQSPLWRKVALPVPDYGDRMPRGRPPLAAAEIELIARWIDEGARPFGAHFVRGDVTGNGAVEIADALALLEFLLSDGEAPPCTPVADANSDGAIDVSDAVTILQRLFIDGKDLAELSDAERLACAEENNPPELEPIGTLDGREGEALEVQVVARDPDGHELTYSLGRAPEAMEIDRFTGVVRWTPAVGDAGRHFFVVRVLDSGRPTRLAETTGRVRVAPGNRPPSVEPADTLYGRELVPLEFSVRASDPEGGALSFETLEAPVGSFLDARTGEFRWTPDRGQAGKHSLRFRVSEEGERPLATEGSVAILILEETSPVNQPPVVPDRAIYRSYPLRPIRLPVGARDPDGDELRYEAEELPPGATFDEVTGTLLWTPDRGQLGPFYVPVTITDAGLPPETIEDILVLKILPFDACVTADCDPGTGCTTEALDLSVGCCAPGERIRVAEPVADCPEGRVLFVGRNRRGFGRLQNCDVLPFTLFAQGGANFRLHIEARCVDTAAPVELHVELEIDGTKRIDQVVTRFLQPRSDGFAQAYALVFPMTVDPVTIVQLDDAPAQLTVTLTDINGVRLTRRLRVFLTNSDTPDLPDPDVEDVQAGEVGCVGCHRPVSRTGERVGIEDAHPWRPLTCTDCHGGNPDALTRQDAHVGRRLQDPRFLRDLTSGELDAISQDYLRFVNPGDLRVARQGCGDRNPAAGGTGCHQRIVETVPLSVMSTSAGHYTLPRFLAGSQSREPRFAAVDVADAGFDAAVAPAGAVAALEALREPDPTADRSAIGTCIDVYIPKSCPTCHLSDFGRNDAAGNFRSSGCTACHMVYGDDGLSLSRDPSINKDFPPHPLRHQLTTSIPTEQCARCHFQGGRIGLAYRGIREGGFSPEKTPRDGRTLGTPLHGHDADYYFSDEDVTNFVDETPPDLHFSAGMDCADCHVGGDVHGDGNLYSSERYQVGIRCEDCHGTVRSEIREDAADGHFKNSKGFTLERLRRDAGNRILLALRRDGRELEVPQISRILASGVNPAMTQAMGVNEHGFSHADRLECYACHTSWRQTCFGCHITIDDSGTQTNRTTGEVTPGAVAVVRDDYSLDFFALGVNQRGRITPLCSSMSIFMSYRDSDGAFRYRDRVRTSADGRRGFGWNPFHHHTVSRVPQSCDRCHPVPGEDAASSSRLRATYGFGTGRVTAIDDSGQVHDLSAFLGDDGELISEFPHPDTGPVPAATRARALSIEVEPRRR